MVGIEVALGLTAAALALLYFYLTATFSYWKDRGVKFVTPLPLVGSMLPVLTLRENIAQFLQRAYREHEDQNYVGFFQGRSPALLVRDPELIKNITVKDFTHFTDHGLEIDEEVNPLQAKNLFNMSGHSWKEMRNKLTPTFTSGRMKGMFPLVQECASEFESHLETLADKGSDLDIKDLLARYTTDVIGSCAFGIKCDSLNDPNCRFRVMGRKIFEANFLQSIKRVIIAFLPGVAKILRLQFTSIEVSEFFRGLVRDVMALRAKTGETRKDFMQLMIELKEKGRLSPEEDEGAKGDPEHITTHSDSTKLTDDDVTAQATVFFFAGFETSSTAVTFALFELARRPELQEKARRQIEEVLQRHGGEVSYQALQEMTFLDWIFQESLRKYPPAPQLLRKCTKNYVIPGSGLTLEKGTAVIIPIYSIQNDPKYFPEPDRFDPERFSEERQNKNTQYTYMPFGEGPRQCIGLRFARMQSKLGLVSVLRRFEVQPSPSSKYPLTLDPRQFLLVSKNTVFIRLSRVKDQNVT